MGALGWLDSGRPPPEYSALCLVRGRPRQASVACRVDFGPFLSPPRHRLVLGLVFPGPSIDAPVGGLDGGGSLVGPRDPEGLRPGGPPGAGMLLVSPGLYASPKLGRRRGRATQELAPSQKPK